MGEIEHQSKLGRINQALKHYVLSTKYTTTFSTATPEKKEERVRDQKKLAKKTYIRRNKPKTSSKEPIEWHHQ